MGDHFPDGCLREGAPEKRDPRAGPVNGLEERKAHDVIPVGVGEDHRILGTFFGDESVSQSADARTGINDDDAILCGADFNAGRVSPIAQVFPPRNRDGSSCPPATDQHALPPDAAVDLRKSRPGSCGDPGKVRNVPGRHNRHVHSTSRKSLSLKMQRHASTTLGSYRTSRFAAISSNALFSPGAVR